MTGVGQRLWIFCFQSLSQRFYFFLRLLSVKQVKATYNGMNGTRTGCKDVLQSAMSAACMVAMPVRNEYIIHIAQVYSQ